MKTIKQLSLFLENRPGTLAAVCRALADASINIFALSVSDSVDHAVVRMVVSHPSKALHLLGEHGVLVVERDVLMLQARNQPGELAEIAEALARHKINIEYAYATAAPATGRGTVVLRVSNPTKAARVLKGH